jgi:hypothetical protein
LTGIVRPFWTIKVDFKNLLRRVEYPEVALDEVKYDLQLTFYQWLVFACRVEGKIVASAELAYL